MGINEVRQKKNRNCLYRIVKIMSVFGTLANHIKKTHKNTLKKMVFKNYGKI